MKGAALFYDDMLIEEPRHHWLVVAPANSPENHFEMKNGQQAAICMGPTMMQQLVRYLFDACIQSSQVLGVDENFRDELMAKRARLAPTRIGSDGRIMEWLEEYQEPELHHRHVSHLWGYILGTRFHAIACQTWLGLPASLWTCGATTVWVGLLLTRARCGRGWVMVIMHGGWYRRH